MQQRCKYRSLGRSLLKQICGSRAKQSPSILRGRRAVGRRTAVRNHRAATSATMCHHQCKRASATQVPVHTLVVALLSPYRSQLSAQCASTPIRGRPPFRDMVAVAHRCRRQRGKRRSTLGTARCAQRCCSQEAMVKEEHRHRHRQHRAHGSMASHRTSSEAGLKPASCFHFE